jgi:hypothetical protein
MKLRARTHRAVAVDCVDRELPLAIVGGAELLERLRARGPVIALARCDEEASVDGTKRVDPVEGASVYVNDRQTET